jgi:hypothetical protein
MHTAAGVPGAIGSPEQSFGQPKPMALQTPHAVIVSWIVGGVEPSVQT